MFQLLYVSSVVVSGQTDAILEKSQRNNRRDQVTGLLYADTGRFMQVLEGGEEAVRATYARIVRDGRHRALVVLSQRWIETRQFGTWDMAFRAPGADAERFMAQVGRLIEGAAPDIRATFDSFVRIRQGSA